MKTFVIAFNENNTLYEIHAQGCKHLMVKKLHVTSLAYVGGDSAWVKKDFEYRNEGCLAKIGPCAKK